MYRIVVPFLIVANVGSEMEMEPYHYEVEPSKQHADNEVEPSKEHAENEVEPSKEHADNEAEPFLIPTSIFSLSSTINATKTNDDSPAILVRLWPQQRNLGVLAILFLLLLTILMYYQKGMEDSEMVVSIPNLNKTVQPEYLKWLPKRIRSSSIKIRQIENYRKGHGLMLDFHITHHAGTTLCFWAKKNGPCPEFACMVGKNVPSNLSGGLGPRHTPWKYNKTDYWIRTIQPVFHYISWEYGLNPLVRSVNDTNWEHPELVSIIVMRHPIERLLSDVSHGHQVINGTEEEWWEYAHMRHTDNFALRTIMSWEGCCQAEKTSSSYVKAAKEYLSRFTFILDMECFDESLSRLSKILGLNYTHEAANQAKKHVKIHNKTLYRYLYHRNLNDIALYQWSKGHSLVKCNEIHDE
jgi:hypothetical protein